MAVFQMHEHSMKKIKFSILVPVYQAERYIDECIQSVLEQTYKNWELILIDDGSVDRSGKICDRYAEKYPDIRVYHKGKSGQLQTRLYGIDRACGDYYVFLDSDDTLKPHALQTMYDNLQMQDCDCLVYGYERVKGNQILERSAKEEEICITDKRELYRKCFLGYYNSLCRKVVRASVFRQGEKEYAPFFHIRIGEDLLHSIEILKNSREVVFIDDRLYNYRLNPHSVMETATYKDCDHIDYIVWETVWDFLNEQKVFNEKDVMEFRGYYRGPITADLCRISSAAISMENKLRLFKEIKSSRYYNIITEGSCDKSKIGIPSRVLFPLFVEGHYRLLIFIAGNSYKYLRNVRRKVKRLLGK